MKIDIASFGGILPKTGRHLLPEGGAAMAVNCRIGSGMLRPLANMRSDHALPAGTGSFYRFKGTWLHYADRGRKYVPGSVYGDAQRLYMSAEDGGLFTWAGEGAACWKLGCAAPATAPSCSAEGSADGSAAKESRAYVYTCVDSLGEESAPSPASSVITVQGQAVSLAGMETPVHDGFAPIVKKRIYRLAVGNESADYMLVAEVDASASAFSDGVQAGALGEALPTMGWRVPDDGLRGLCAVASGSYAAFCGSEVRLSEPGYPYAWPDAYSYRVEYDIVGMAASGSMLFIFTTGPVYWMNADDAGNAAPVRMDELCPCVSASSIVPVAGGAVFASGDGLYFVGSGYANPSRISSGFYSVKEWQALNPSSMFGCLCNSTLYLFYRRTDGESGGLVFDLGNSAEGGLASSLTTLNTAIDYAVTVPYGELMYVAHKGQCWQWEGERISNLTAEWRSRSYLLGNRVNFTSCMVEQSIDDDDDESSVQKSVALTRYLEANFGHVNGGVGMLPVAECAFASDGAFADVNAQIADTQPRVTVQICADNAVVYSRRVRDRQPFVLPAGFTGRTWWVRLTTNRDVRRVALAESMGELYE